MSSHLKKLGLSDTKFELKYHTPKCSRTAKDFASSAKHHPHPQAQQEQATVLSILMELIGRKQREACPLPDHDHNPIKFLCLEENCPVRAGCSYCFLDGHKGHAKIESRTCLKDLSELHSRAQTSRELLRAELLIRKQELLAKLETEVSSIKQEFLSSLDYMNKKIREAIEAKFSQNLAQFGKERQYTTLNDKEIETFREVNTTNLQEDDSDIISKFMLSTSKQADPKPSIRSISKYPLRRECTPQVVLSRQDEHQLLVKLSRLNLTYVQQYLKHEAAHLREFMGGFRIYEQFYTELNSSLSEFFAAFKRALPSFKTLELGLQQPEVLQSFPHRP